MERSIKVRVVKENSNKVTILFVNLNRKMPLSKKVFLERVESGLYDVVNENHPVFAKD